MRSVCYGIWIRNKKWILKRVPLVVGVFSYHSIYSISSYGPETQEERGKTLAAQDQLCIRQSIHLLSLYTIAITGIPANFVLSQTSFWPQRSLTLSAYNRLHTLTNNVRGELGIENVERFIWGPKSRPWFQRTSAVYEYNFKNKFLWCFSYRQGDKVTLRRIVLKSTTSLRNEKNFTFDFVFSEKEWKAITFIQSLYL